MKRITKLIALLLVATFICSCLSSCSNKEIESTPVEAKDFRITAYLVGSDLINNENFDASHFSQLTDIILFGLATFDESGNIALDENFNDAYNKLLELTKDTDAHIYINLLGPDFETESDDWNKQMKDKAIRHTNAFQSGNLQGQIVDILNKYAFDGVYFDYEYPLEKKYWKEFDSFLIELDKVIGDKKIGIAVADWNANQSKEAMAVTDYVEVMAYDLWDDDGTHASFDMAVSCMNKMVKLGYDKAKLTLGVPFYARPTTKEAYWYDYKGYVDSIDDKGLINDKETNLTFSFNNYDLIAKKTKWAMDNGFGGIMIWHYSCDLPQSDSRSLFNAIYTTKEAAINE